MAGNPASIPKAAHPHLLSLPRVPPHRLCPSPPSRPPPHTLIIHQGRKLTSAGLDHLRTIPLTRLDLIDCRRLVTDAAVAALQGLPLASLALRQCLHLTSAGILHLQGMSTLTSLDLSSNDKLGDECLEVLRKLPLTQLDLSCSEWFSKTTLEGLLGLPLVSLSLARSLPLSGANLLALRRLTLTSLDLSGCEWLCDGHLAYCLSLMPLRYVLAHGVQDAWWRKKGAQF